MWKGPKKAEVSSVFLSLRRSLSLQRTQAKLELRFRKSRGKSSAFSFSTTPSHNRVRPPLGLDGADLRLTAFATRCDRDWERLSKAPDPQKFYRTHGESPPPVLKSAFYPRRKDCTFGPSFAHRVGLLSASCQEVFRRIFIQFSGSSRDTREKSYTCGR